MSRASGRALLALAALFLFTGADDPRSRFKTPQWLDARANAPMPELPADAAPPVGIATTPAAPPLMASAQTILLFSALSLAPAAVLMVTAFVRIQIVLTLLRQALGSPQVPGNQVVMMLALLLTALVMRPVAESVYQKGIKPYMEKRLDEIPAFEAGTAPVKAFMIAQLDRTGHQSYCWELWDRSQPANSSANLAEPTEMEQFPLTILAPAYLLSELTTAFFIGFAVYLPFLVVDLVVSAVLSAMGLFMLPPSLVALPLKLILFVLADGWMLVSGMLLRSFAV